MRKNIIILSLIFILALALRTIPFLMMTFAPEKTIFHDTDPYYHMRRVVNLLENNFRMIEFDYYLDYPKGAVSFWPPGFDKMLAGFVWIVNAGRLTEEAIEKTACWFPPIIGALTIFLVWLLGREIFSNKVGLFAAFLFALQPTHIAYSELGKIDHHVAETFSALLFYYFFIKVLKSIRSPGKPYLWSLLTGVGIWFSYMMWTGATLYIIPLFATIYLLLFYFSKKNLFRYLNSCIIITSTALILLLYPCLTSWWGRQSLFTHDALSLFQVSLFLGLLLFFLLLKATIYLLKSTKEKISILIFTILFSLSGILLLKTLSPQIFGVIVEGLALLAKRGEASYHVWLTTISEYTPLVFIDGRFIWQRAVSGLSWGIFLVPLGILFLYTAKITPCGVTSIGALPLWRSAKTCFASLSPPGGKQILSPRPPNHRYQNLLKFRYLRINRPYAIFLTIITIFLGALAFQQSRYCYIFGFNVALFSAFSLFVIYDFLRDKRPIEFKLSIQFSKWIEQFKSRLSFRRWPGFGLDKIFIILVLFVLLKHSQMLSNSLFAQPRGPILTLEDCKTLEWIRDNTPETKGYNDPTQKPEYGIMNIWDWGHFIEYISQRPAAVNPYGMGIDKMVNFYLAKTENEANKIMEQNECRYVITSDPAPLIDGLRKISMLYPGETYRFLQFEGPMLRLPKQEFLNLMGVKLHLHDGVKPYVPDMDVEGLQHYRLVYESPEISELQYVGGPVTTHKLKIFEYVKGARLRGKTTPNTDVEISLNIQTNIGREFIYRNVFPSDNKGNYEIILPYSTRGSPYPVLSISDYEVKVGKRVFKVKVKEDEVLNGKNIS